jgi:putative AdoMet-dependent methyltransferase
MRSKNVEKFTHDDQAERYDSQVAIESNPIRSGYRQALDWLGSQVPNGRLVLDLGTGTGNTILALPEDCDVTAVDVSEKMLAVAKSKLASRHVEYITDDILGFFDIKPAQIFDVIVSSYAIHHLTDHEKEVLFHHVHNRLTPNGRVVFVDLMYRNNADKDALLQKYRHTHDVLESFEEEFFWNLEESVEKLTEIGFNVSWCQFSDLSFGIVLDLFKSQ